MSARDHILARLRDAAPVANRPAPDVADWYAGHRPVESSADKAARFRNCIELAQTTPVKLRFRRRLLPNYMMTPQDLERTGILKVERDAPGNFQTVYEVLASVTKDKAVVVTRVGEASNAAAPGAAAPAAPGAATPVGGTP